MNLDQNSQTSVALATILGLMAILVEELARTRAVDADRLIEDFDHFTQSARAASGTSPKDVQYVERLVEMIKSGLVAKDKESGNE